MANTSNGRTVCVIGDAVVDLVSCESELPLSECRTFRRQAGGSCANVARFLASQGVDCRFAGAVGKDGLGAFLLRALDDSGLDTTHVTSKREHSTSCVIVNKTAGSPEYIPYLGAHTALETSDIEADAFLGGATLIHSNAMSLSREPSRSTILGFIERASELGLDISFDPNWRPRLGPERGEALEAIASIASRGAWLKPSLDDATFLLGHASEEELARRFLDMGASVVVLTLGARGSLVADAHGFHRVEPSGTLECATGAGDAFWSLFLAARLAGAGAREAAEKASAAIVGFLAARRYS